MPVKPAEPDDKQDRANPWAIALGAGSELVVCVLLGFFAGQWLDKRFKTGPWLMLLGAMTGICVGLYQLIRVASTRRDGR